MALPVPLALASGNEHVKARAWQAGATPVGLPAHGPGRQGLRKNHPKAVRQPGLCPVFGQRGLPSAQRPA